MENIKETNKTPEVRDEDLNQVSGGVMIPGKREEKPPCRKEPFQYKINHFGKSNV